MKDTISARKHRVRSIEEIKIARQREWAHMEEEILDELRESVPKRITQMLKNKRGSTKY